MVRFVRGAAILCVVLTPAAAFPQGKFFNSNGVQIRYLEQGTGDPVVLGHGRGDTIESSWVVAGVLPNLAKSYRVIALDCRGHGKSGKPHDSKLYGPEMGLDIVRLLDHLGIARAHVVGYSMGANIVAQLLTTHPDRSLTATLGGSAGRFRWTAQNDQLFEEEAAETQRWGFSPSMQLRTAPPNTPKLTEEEIKRRSAVAIADINKDRHAVAALIRSFRDQVITPAQVSAVSVPTMGIAGSADPLLLDVQDLKNLRPAVQLVVIDGATHSGERGARSRPEFVAAIRAFISSHSQMPR